MSTTTRPETTFRVLYVLGGAYRAGDPRSTLTHAARADRGDEGAALCKRVRPESIDDHCLAQDAGTVPTCPVCAKRLAKIPGAVVIGAAE